MEVVAANAGEMMKEDESFHDVFPLKVKLFSGPFPLSTT
jgi:hypothetical protein